MASMRAKTAVVAPAIEMPAEKAPQPEIAITFVDDEEIAEMNAHYRRKPRPTDVLSFAQSEGEEFPGAFEYSDEDAETPDDFVTLGDVVISIQTAWKQAQERHHSLEDEVAFLAVHGTLHLMGYDHLRAHERRAMWKQQEAIWEQLREDFARKRSAM
jgi:probable rRNA maturation factor